MCDGMKKYLYFLIAIFLAGFLLFSGCISDTSNENADTNGKKDNNENGGSVEASFLPANYPPFNLEKVAYILPMGGMTSSHVTPIDHQYYVSYDFWKGDAAAVDINVYSPWDGVVKNIQHMTSTVDDNPEPVDDFRIEIMHSTTLSSTFIHIDELSDKLMAEDPGPGNYASINVVVIAGEIIGNYSGSVDYNIVDTNVTLCFINPQSYSRESWKIHCPDPFDYFNESIKNEMIGKCLRSADPAGGKICYDIDGRLVGNWFLNNTNGYEGADPNRYWAGHLAIVYDDIDADAIIVSIGTFVDSARQFSVKNNSPDPANVTVGELVEYELVDFSYFTDYDQWDSISLVKGLKIRNYNDIQGVILLQLIEDRLLKVEIFPDKSADDVSGFTESASFYVR